MKFHICYSKKDCLGEISKEVEFKNLAALKRWYKKEFDKGNMEYPYCYGWNCENNKSFSYLIESYYRKVGTN